MSPQLQDVQRGYIRATRELLAREPSGPSKFMANLSIPPRDGQETFATLFSGGILSSFHQNYVGPIFAQYIDDLHRGHVLSVNEIASNTVGVRVFFELDYRSLRTPPAADQLQHVRIASQVVQDCFPGHDCSAYVAVSSLAKIKKLEGQPCVAFGLHIIFPAISVTTDVLRRLGLLLDARITCACSGYAQIVDSQSVHKASASLRLIYAHKYQACQYCSTAATTNKPKDAAAEWVEDPRSLYIAPPAVTPAAEVMGDDCDFCSNRRKIACPSVYIPSYIMLADGSIHYLSVEEKKNLRMCRQYSIVPDQMGHIPLCHEPHDMPTVTDVCPRGPVVFKKESRLFKGFTSRKGTKEVSGANSTAFGLIRKVLTKFPNHVDTSIDRVHISKESTILVNLKGKNSRFCPTVNRNHSSNRVYIRIDLKRRSASVHCYAATCGKATLTSTTLGSDLVLRLASSLGVHVSAMFTESKLSLGVSKTGDRCYIDLDIGMMVRPEPVISTKATVAPKTPVAIDFMARYRECISTLAE